MFKDWIEFRRNKKTVKRELTKVIAKTLPTADRIASGGVGFLDFLFKLIDGANKVTSDEVIKYTISGAAEALKTNESRVMEMLQYIATLSQEDIMRLVSAAAVNSGAFKGTEEVTQELLKQAEENGVIKADGDSE